MLTIIDRYLLRHFLRALAVVTIAVGLTFMVINAVEELRDFIDHDVPLIQIFEYYIYFGGWIIKSFLPMFVLLAVLFSVSMLARRNEILAMKSAGISLYRLAAPFVVVAAIIAVGHFYYNEYIYPPAGKRKAEIKEFTIENRSKKSFEHVSNIYRQISPGHFYTIANMNVPRAEGTDLKIFHEENNRLLSIITAATIRYHNFRWVASEVIVRNFDDRAQESFAELDSLILPEIKEEPKDFARRVGKSNEMGIDELRHYIAMMKRVGGPHIREQVDLGLKYSFPMASILIVLVSIPFAANPRRGGTAVSFSIGALISLFYFVLFRAMQSAGYNERVPLEVAVWGVNGLFLAVGLVIMIRARK